MPLLALIAVLWVLFVILVIAALSGWLVNIVYFFAVCFRALVDVGCQLWIDVSKLPKVFKARKRERIELDEYERHLS